MCDTLATPPAFTADGHAWLAKNSDREGDEAQHVEVLPESRPAGPRERCTWIEVPAAPTLPVMLSRPTWMWGAEMGVNALGVAIGNQAVFTRLPVARVGLTGMDLVRLGVARASTAEAALHLLIDLIGAHGQGGACSLRSARYRYHNAFLIADPREVWLLETAGAFWAALRVQRPHALSNALTIGEDHDMLHPGAEAWARQRGWWRGEGRMDFAATFGDPIMRTLAGAAQRRACTQGHLDRAGTRIALGTFLGALRDHGPGQDPRGPWRLEAPCSHSNSLPTRRTGQTTASMVARLDPAGPCTLWTGTPAPCLGVFKPVSWERPGAPGGLPGLRPDGESLFWAAERAHRAALRAWPSHPGWRRQEADALERAALAAASPAVCAAQAAAFWEEDRRRWERSG